VSVIRLFRFVPVRPSFDHVLRTEMIPDLLAKPGIVDFYSGRQGPGEVGPRITVSVWSSRDAMVEAIGDRLGVFHPELLGDTTDHELEILGVLVEERVATDPPTILRSLRGRTRPGELPTYAADVRRGVGHDAQLGHAPMALYLADRGDDRFVTISAWREWADIEWATGGDVRRPAATRQSERLLEWDVEHYEIVARDVTAATRPRAADPT
jgi:hypothetical protein